MGYKPSNGCISYMLKLDYVLMIHGLKQFRFLFEQLDALLLQCLALDHLHCDLLIRLLVNSLINSAEGAFAKHTLKLIMI